MRSLGQRYSVAVFACAFTHASSFTLLSVRGVLCSVQFLVFFFPPSSPFSFSSIFVLEMRADSIVSEQ